MATVIIAPHCEQCGSTRLEDTDTVHDPDLQGYSACCNEPVVTGEHCLTDCTHD